MFYAAVCERCIECGTNIGVIDAFCSNITLRVAGGVTAMCQEVEAIMVYMSPVGNAKCYGEIMKALNTWGTA